MTTPRIRNATIGGVSRPVDLLHNWTATPGAEYPVGGPVGVTWTRVFTEEFAEANTAGLLAPGTWATGWFGTGVTGPVNSAETAFYDPALLSVSGGQATFTLTANSTSKVPTGWSGSVKPNLGAQISTDPFQANPGFTMSYGYIEARLQQPAGTLTEGVWPGFWLNNNNWPTGMEVDVLEGDGTDTGCAFNIHYGATAGVETLNLNGSGRIKTVTGATSGFHTYAVHIQPSAVTFYYDGIAVGGYSGAVVNAQRYVLIGNSTSGTITTPKNLVVDYIRGWV